MNVKNSFKTILLTAFFGVVAYNGNASLYENGFEKRNDIRPWMFNNNYSYYNWRKQVTIGTIGLSSEKVHSGSKAFKLDITFKKASKYCYFRIPLSSRKLIANPLYISGYFKVKKDSGLKVTLGRGLFYQGKIHGLGVIKSDKTPDGWNFSHENLYKFVKWVCENGRGKAKKWDKNKNYISSILLMIKGDIKPGDQVIIYVDDLKISAEKPKMTIPSKEANANLYFLNKRKRYEVRNKLFLAPRKGNIFSNSSFELGIKDWTVDNANTPDETFCNVAIDNNIAHHGKKSLRITHQKPITSIISSAFLPTKNKNAARLSFWAKARGNMTVAGNKIGTEWKKYSAPIGTHWKHNDMRYAYLKVAGNGTLWFDAVSTGQPPNEKFKTTNDLELGIAVNNDSNISNIFSNKKKLTLNLALFNGESKPENGKLSYQIKDFYHKTVKQGEFDFNLESDEGIIKNIPISFPNGIFYVYVKSSSNGKNRDYERNFAIIQDLDSKKINKKSFFGTSQLHWTNYNRESGLTQRLGVKYQNVYGPCYFSRAPKNWREKLANKTLWQNSDAENIVKHLKKYGIEPVFVIHGLPKWLDGNTSIHSKGFVPKEKFVKEWGDYVFSMVRHFKGQIKYWEIWPEVVHNRKDAKNFFPFLKQAYIMAKKANPDCVVLGAGFDPGTAMVSNAKHMFELGALKYLDKVSLHPYFIYCHSSPEVGNVERSLKQLHSLIKKHSGQEKDIWITEVSYQGTNTYYTDLPGIENFGYSVLVSEERMADYIARMMLIAMANKVKKFMLFPTLHGGIKVFSGFYGITYENCTEPKAGFPAYNTLATYLTDASAGDELKLKPGFKCYIYRKPADKAVAAIWNSSDNKSAMAKLIVPAGEYRFIDLMNNTITPKQENASKFITLHGGSPVLITADNYSALKQLLNKVKIINFVPTVKLTVSDDLKSLKIKIKNNTPRKLDCSIAIKQSPVEWGIKKNTYKSIVSKHSSKTTTINFKHPISYSAKNKAIEIDVKMGKINKLLKFKPIFCNKLSTSFTNKKLLKNVKNIKSLSLGKSNFESLLSPKELYRKNDINGKFYSGWNSNGLYLAFDVNDNHFYQPYIANRIWAGDSIQIAFDVKSNSVKNEGYNADDLEYGLALTDKGPEGYCFKGAQKGKADKIELNISKNDTNIYYQVFLPWSCFQSFVPKNGASMGFNFTMMDNDGRKITKKFLYLSDGIAGKSGKKPFRFYDLVLTR